MLHAGGDRDSMENNYKEIDGMSKENSRKRRHAVKKHKRLSQTFQELTKHKKRKIRFGN